MKYNFKNIGYIDEGKVDLADLTLICGPNNVGKTYISYSIYGFLKHFKTLVDVSLTPSQLEQLKEDGSISIDLMIYKENLSKYLKSASKQFSKTLGGYFNAPDELFLTSMVEFSSENFCVDLRKEYNNIVRYGRNETIIFDKAPEETSLSIAIQSTGESKLPTRILMNVVNDGLADCLFSNTLLKPFVVTSERTGISLFYKELDISKNAIIEHLTQSEKTDPIAILNSMRSRYARPIQDNIDVVRDYENISKNKSFIRKDREKYKPVLDALQELLGGTFKSVEKQVIYQQKKERKRERVSVPVYIASSSIKSLFLVDLYINFLAEKQGLLIIDEPELNLHPDNQRKMANLLVRLVNSGIKVLVTTHSDYLVREINNRIMLSNDFKEKASIMSKSKLSSLDVLRPDQVKAFSLKADHKISKVDVDKYGVNMEIFDELIADANALSDDIYYSLEG